MKRILVIIGLLLCISGVNANECPASGNHPCNNSMFIDIGNKQFLYIESSYLCGDVNGDGVVNSGDSTRLDRFIQFPFWILLQCNPPIINYEILNYNNYVGTDIIRPLRSDIYD